MRIKRFLNSFFDFIISNSYIGFWFTIFIVHSQFFSFFVRKLKSLYASSWVVLSVDGNCWLIILCILFFWIWRLSYLFLIYDAQFNLVSFFIFMKCSRTLLILHQKMMYYYNFSCLLEIYNCFFIHHPSHFFFSFM